MDLHALLAATRATYHRINRTDHQWPEILAAVAHATTLDEAATAIETAAPHPRLLLYPSAWRTALWAVDQERGVPLAAHQARCRGLYDQEMKGEQ